MSKLLKLKEWVSLEDAILLIAAAIDHPVTLKDIYQLTLERKIVLSINLTESYRAVLGSVEIDLYDSLVSNYRSSSKATKTKEDTLKNKEEIEQWAIKNGEFTKYCPIFSPSKGEEKSPWDHYTDNQVTRISGIWDLPMIGSEAFYIECHLYDRNCDPSNPPFMYETYLQRGELFARLVDFVNNKSNLYRDATSFPDEAELIIRTSELQRFINEATNQSSIDKNLGSREKDNLLKLIGALMMVLKHKDGANLSQANIINFIHEQGYSETEGLSQRQIEKVFSEANKLFSEV